MGREHTVGSLPYLGSSSLSVSSAFQGTKGNEVLPVPSEKSTLSVGLAQLLSLKPNLTLKLLQYVTFHPFG